MRKYLLGFAVMGVLFATGARAFPYAFCQVELLKVASEALSAEFKGRALGVEQFRDISVNFNEPLRPKAVFFGDGKPGSKRYCLVQVHMQMPEERFPAQGCPVYKVEEIESNCP